jgi:hypothetical protein
VLTAQIMVGLQQRAAFQDAARRDPALRQPALGQQQPQVLAGGVAVEGDVRLHGSSAPRSKESFHVAMRVAHQSLVTWHSVSGYALPGGVLRAVRVICAMSAGRTRQHPPMMSAPSPRRVVMRVDFTR